MTMGLVRALESEYLGEPGPLTRLRGTPHVDSGGKKRHLASGPAEPLIRDRGRFGTSARHHGHMSCRG